ncbi:MAG TPA: hypothetical protein VJN42_09475 [Candidatus Acidoferrum sp.]|nr:hypothetical protein [Candidatus Acidoferrum sp.]
MVKNLILLAGLGLFVWSFFLRAVDDWTGTQSALLALSCWKEDRVSHLVLFGGLINPLTLLFLLLTPAKSAARFRTYLAAVILFFIALTWFALARMEMHVRVGHFVWIGGVLLMSLTVIADIPRLPHAKWMAATAIAVIVWFSVPLAIRHTMRPATTRDDFYYVAGWNFREPSACRKIDPRAIGREDQRDDEFELTYLQSDCLSNVAAMLHRPDLCAEVRSAGFDRVVGSRVTAWECKWQQYTQGSAAPLDGEDFVHVMQDIGVDQADLAEFMRQRNGRNGGPDSPATDADYFDYYEYLVSDDTAARRRFLGRVLKLKPE